MTDTPENNQHALDALVKLIAPIGLSLSDTGGKVRIFGNEPDFKTSVRLGGAFAVAAMAAAIGPAAIWRERSGEGQDLSIDVGCAGHGVNPDFTFNPTLNGHPYPNWIGNFHPFGIVPFQTRDGRWVYPSGVYPKMQTKWGDYFNCATDFKNIAAAIAKRDALELEDAANAAGHTLCIARTVEEWAAHPAGQYLSAQPFISVTKIGDSEPEPFHKAARPLSGVNVLSLTHAVAGPVVGRTLAEQGANVLCVNDQDYELDLVYDDANVGQRSCYLDLNNPEHNKRCRELWRDADVFVDSFRSRKMAGFGFSPEELAERRPGIIVVNVRCYGYDGPWSDRGGFDMLGSAASGLTMVDSTDGRPALPPTGMLNDYITGYLGAAGAVAALLRRSREGGSYHVSVNLTGSAMFALSLDRKPGAERLGANPLFDVAVPTANGCLTQEVMNKVAAAMVAPVPGLRFPKPLVRNTPMGILSRLPPAIAYSATPGQWRDPLLVPRTSDQPFWG